MKKRVALLLLVLSFVLLVVGCGRKEQQETGEAKKTDITIKDSTGKNITLSKGLSKIVVLDSDAAEALRVLGISSDIIAGVSDNVREDPYLGLKGKPSVGKSFTPSIEKIVQLKPQAVITYGKWPDTKLEEKLEPVGIRVIRLDFYKPETYDRDLTALAKIFQKEKRAETFLKWKREKTAVVTERVKKLKEQKKVRVCGTWYSSLEKGEWKPYARGTALHQGIELAGGVNIAQELEGYPAVSAEWVLQKNPDAVVFGVLEEKGLGYAAVDSTVAAGLSDHALQNEVLSKTGAGKRERLYFLNTELLGGSKTYLGALYLAKWFYPELFKDIDPNKVLKEYFKEWLGVPFKGIWAYPGS